MKTKKEKKKIPLRRLLLLNAVAAFALLFATVVVLWATGLLGSIFAFLF